REGKQPWTSAQTGLRSNLIIDAIYESSRTGGEVKLDWSL
ncbi:MAG: gfo/Idh/MocA family oxidoreductase, partial [Cohnella sp.]|nr:gfo/Idh/MocA family oxidoreductase [Cohnella sp.]